MLDFSNHVKLARRAADFMQQSQQPGSGSGEKQLSMPSWGIFVLVFTVLAYYVSLIKIRYTLGSVVGTLAIVEEAESNILVEAEYSDEEGLDKKTTDNLLEPELAVIKVKPVTSNIRTAISLLKARGGRRGQFRGFSLCLVYLWLKSVLTILFASLLRMHATFVAVIVAETLLAKLELVWVHHIISEPSSTSWLQRARSTQVAWKKIAPAAFIRAVAFQYAMYMPMYLLCTFKPISNLMHGNSNEVPLKEAQQAMIYAAGALILSLTLVVLVCIPSHVTFVRTAASLLPEEEQTIVTFDRTFGGKITAGEKIGYLDAWKTFSWAQRRRYLGLLVKIGAVMTAVTVLFTIVVATEVSLFTGLRIQDLVKSQLN